MNDNFRQRMKEIADNQAASPKSPAISQARYNAIRDHLLDSSKKVDPHFKHWVKTRKFEIVDLPGLGLQQVLVIPNDHEKNQLDGTARFLIVVHTPGDLCDIVYGVHADELKHSGYKESDVLYA